MHLFLQCMYVYLFFKPPIMMIFLLSIPNCDTNGDVGAGARNNSSNVFSV